MNHSRLHLSSTILLAGWLFLTAPLQAEERVEIPVFTAYYELLRNDNMKLGEVKRAAVRQANGTTTFKSDSHTTGLAALFVKDTISEHTTFVVENSTIQPQDYRYDRKGGKRAREAHLNFNWPEKRVTNAINGEAWQMEIQPGTQDKLSYQLQIMLDLQAGRTHFTYPVADGGTLKEYRFTHLGEETITTPMGQIETVKIRRERAANSKRKTTIWFARSLHYLPVRITQGKSDNNFITLEISKVEGL